MKDIVDVLIADYHKYDDHDAFIEDFHKLKKRHPNEINFLLGDVIPELIQDITPT